MFAHVSDHLLPETIVRFYLLDVIVNLLLVIIIIDQADCIV